MLGFLEMGFVKCLGGFSQMIASFPSISEMACINVSPDTQDPHSGNKLRMILSVIIFITILLPSVCDVLFLFPLVFAYETTYHCCQKLS